MSRKNTIDWLVNPDGTPGKTHNIVKGCNGPAGDGKHCSYCYAVKAVKRWDYAERVARKEAEWDFYCDSSEAENDMIGRLMNKIVSFEPYFFRYVLEQKLRKKPTMYFFSMSDPADWEKEWYEKIRSKIEEYPQHIFVILTKRPEVYKRYSFPENCWLGVTIEKQQQLHDYLKLAIPLSNLRFLSLEPIQEKIYDCCDYFQWIIVGPERGKIIDRDLLTPFFTLDVPVFMKESCRSSLYQGEALRQDWPDGYLIER